MKIKVYVVDMEIPPRAKRWMLRLGLPILIILGGLTIAYAAVPKMWAPNEQLKSADLNMNFATIDQQIANLQTKVANTGLACALRQGPQSKGTSFDPGSPSPGSIVGCAQGEMLVGGMCSPFSGKADPVGRNDGEKVYCALTNPSADANDYVVAQATCCRVAQLN